MDVYQFSYRTVDKYRTLEKRYPVPIEDRIYSSPGFGRYDWAHPCSFFYRRSHLIKHHIQFPVAKVGEDGPFVEMALYCAESFSRRNRLMLTYWENMDSCLHTTPVLTGVKERYASALQEQSWFAQFGDSIDPNAGYVWQIAEHLPRICAENSFSSVAQFMGECCLPILARRPDIHFAPERQDRLDAWRVSPRRFWLKQKVKLGLPLTIKRICYLIPGLHRIVNHIYNKYHRGFTPIHN